MTDGIPTVEVTCRKCDAIFSIPRAKGWHNYKYCGSDCAQAAKRAYRPQYLHEFARRPITVAETGDKTCRKCGMEKPVAQFHRSTNYADGRQNRCATCTSAYGKKCAKRETPEHRTARLAKHRARTYAWKQENKEWIRDYTAKTTEQNTERHRRWRKANPDKFRAIIKANDGRRRSAEKCGMSGPEMREWWAAQKKICHWCGARCPKDAQADHITALSKGGTHTANNLCIACPKCNQRKSAKDPLAFAREIGLLL